MAREVIHNKQLNYNFLSKVSKMNETIDVNLFSILITLNVFTYIFFQTQGLRVCQFVRTVFRIGLINIQMRSREWYALIGRFGVKSYYNFISNVTNNFYCGKMNSSRKILSLIQKKPYTQQIQGIKYTYSILPKKQKAFVLTHDRFVVIRGIEEISYAKEFPKDGQLPFRSPAQLPRPKAAYQIAQIQKTTQQQEKLYIHFSDGEQWVFICPSLGCAHEWRRRIEETKQQYNIYLENKYKPYQEPIVEAIGNQMENSFTNKGSNFNPFFITPPKNEDKPIESVTNALVSNFLPESSPPPPPKFFEQKPQESPKLRIESQQPLKIQPQQSDIDGMKQAILKIVPSNSFIKNAGLSLDAKQKIKSDVFNSRRNWIEDIISSKQPTQLIFDFKRYAQKIVRVIVDEIYISNTDKVFPQNEIYADFANYYVEDVYVEVYFYNEENIEKKHERELAAIREMKNYDYLLQATKNEGYLLVPLMVIFQYKGFTGLVKTRINSNPLLYQNQFLYTHLDLDEFIQDSRVAPEILLDESKCKIVSYQTKRVFMNEEVTKVFFIQRFHDFLPYECSDVTNEKYQLRPELISDEALKLEVFREKQKPLKSPQVRNLIQRKIHLFIKTIQQQQQYFINSKQLTQVVHSFGLNLTHLGQIYKQAKLGWFRRILQAQLAARCMKNFYRLDMQICLKNQTQRKDPSQKHTDKQKKAAICFLNIVFGNSSDTYQLWLKMNAFSKKYFQIPIWQERFEDININYLLQAIQYHLNIVLSNEAHQRNYFKSMHSLYDSDFVQFQNDITIYNLDFSQNFEKIHSSLENKSAESFHQLCSLVNRQTTRGRKYLDLLRDHLIFQSICEYFLTFIAPDEYPAVYSKMQEFHLPSRFIFECQMTQIKWHIKSNKQQNINISIRFIQINGKKWLGEVHPLFVRLNRVLAQSYNQIEYYANQALVHATQALKMEQQINKGDAPWLWKDYYLIGKIHFNQRNLEKAITCLAKAQELAKSNQNITDYQNYGEMILTLSKCLMNLQRPVDAYNMARDLYNKIKNQWSQAGKSKLVGCVSVMKALLQKNQQHQAYAKFIEYDFSNQLTVIIDNNVLLTECLRLVAIPFLKRTILQKTETRVKFYRLMAELCQINVAPQTCFQYFLARIKQNKFPQRFINILKNFEGMFDEITNKNIIGKWIAYYKLSNQTLLMRIVGAQISKDFELLADLTGMMGIFGEDFRKQLQFMQN